MKHFVYILRSEMNDRYYVGSCCDIDQRLERHNAGATKSTKPYRPWVVVYSEEFDSNEDARKHESQIKRMKSRKYIQALIERVLKSF